MLVGFGLQIAYCMDLYKLDLDIRAQAHTNAPALVIALIRQRAARNKTEGNTQGSQPRGHSTLELLRNVKKGMAMSRRRTRAYMVSSNQRKE